MKQRIISLALMMWMVFVTAFWEGSVSWAAMTGGITDNAVTEAYFLVKESSDGEWLSRYNYIHYITIDGVRMPAYCVEASRKNPPVGSNYQRTQNPGLNYSETTLAGLQEIVRHGYPYTTGIISGVDLTPTEAQAATQMAIRMWLSYRKEQEGADYRVSAMYNPEPVSGAVRIRAGTVTRAKEVYDSSLFLFKTAKEGGVTDISVASEAGSLVLPKEGTKGYFTAEIKVQLKNCSYAVLKLPDDVTVTRVDKGTAECLYDGSTVGIKIPASYRGTRMDYVVEGYSNKTPDSLQFFEPSDAVEEYQRLFIPVKTQYRVITQAQSMSIPALDSYGILRIRKSAFRSGERLSGAGFDLYEWNETSGDYVLSGDYLLREGARPGEYEVFDSDGNPARILYTEENRGKVRIVETRAPQGYSAIDPDDGQPYAWECSFEDDGTEQELIIEAVNYETLVKITKKADGENSGLSGAVLAVYDKNDVEVLRFVSDGGAKEICGTLTAGETYRLHEIEAPNGYVAAEDILFTVPANGTVCEIVMQDKPTKVSVEKISALTGQPISGAVLQIKDGENVIEEWTSDGTAHEMIAKLTAGHTYVLYEVSAPDGYVKCNVPVEFTVREDMSMIGLILKNEETSVEISKITEGGAFLAGATLAVYNEKDELVVSFLSEEEEYVLRGLPFGRYRLVEWEAPAGYEIAEDVTFEVTQESLGQPVVMINSVKEQVPKTGDETRIFGLVAALFLSGVGFLWTAFRKSCQ